MFSYVKKKNPSSVVVVFNKIHFLLFLIQSTVFFAPPQAGTVTASKSQNSVKHCNVAAVYKMFKCFYWFR